MNLEKTLKNLMTLSVIVITKNEEWNIRRCLEQVEWADEIIIVDAFSQDKTVEIAKEYTDKVFSHHWTSYFDQRSFALGLATCDFVLGLDADEVLDKTSQDEIKKTLSHEEYYNGYDIMRETYFLGKRLFYSQMPDVEMRLFKREASFISKKIYDEGYFVRGRTKLIRGLIKHYTSNTISERLKKIDRYSTLWAQKQARYCVKKPSSIKMIYAPVKSFVGNFFIASGFLDGLPGFMWCALKAFENFLKYAKLYFLLDQKMQNIFLSFWQRV